MRNITIFLILIHFSTSAQIKYHADSTFYFESVYKVELNKEEIRNKTNEWIALNFKNSNNVIKMNSEDKIIAKGNLDSPDKDFDLIIEFKEDRFKILIDNIQKFDKPIDYDKYYKNGKMVDYDEFLKLMPETLRSMGAEEKIIKKAINSELMMKTSYNTTKLDYENWHLKNKGIKSKLSNIANSLYSYINNENQSQNDW
jgi:hypothetical protein